MKNIDLEVLETARYHFDKDEIKGIHYLAKYLKVYHKVKGVEAIKKSITYLS